MLISGLAAEQDGCYCCCCCCWHAAITLNGLV